MNKLNENIFHLYDKWKQGYVRKENSLQLRLQNFLDVYKVNKKSVFYDKMPKCTISEDGRKVNVRGSVNILIRDEYLINGKLPIPFAEVKGIFNINGCDDLISLEGAPEKVGGDFDCRGCPNLTSLKGAPEKVGGDFLCSECKSLKSFDGLPKKIGGYLVVDDKFKKKLSSYDKAEKGVISISEYNPIPF